MPYFTYDTSVCISRKLTDFHEMPQNFRMSAIVLMELVAGAHDDSRRKFYEEISRRYQKSDLLIVPNFDDWLLAAKILFLLTQRRNDHKEETCRSCLQAHRNGWRWMF